MNTIRIENNKIYTSFVIDSGTIIINTNDEILINYKDSDIVLKFKILDNIKTNITEIVSNTTLKSDYILSDNSYVILNRFNIKSNITTNIELDGNKSEILYSYSSINKIDTRYLLNINHNNTNTISNVYNRGLNIEGKDLTFIINGYIPKLSTNTICNHHNMIITKNSTNSKIIPNLIIDNNDIISSHSAYIGGFNEDESFYIKTRGLDNTKTEHILSKAFLLGKMTLSSETKQIIIDLLNDNWR